MAFVVNPNLETELARDAQVLAACLQVAGQVATEAQRIAQTDAYRTGAYMRGIVPGMGEGASGPVAQVQATDWKSILIEFGFTSEGTTRPPKAILRRAGEALGYRTRMTHK